jgi:excisionase family DNA binding protein
MIKQGRLKSVEDDIMTLEEVAAYLRLKPQTIYTWAQEKKIPAAKLGKEWRFKKSIIDEWFLQHIDEKFRDVINVWKEKQGKRRDL